MFLVYYNCTVSCAGNVAWITKGFQVSKYYTKNANDCTNFCRVVGLGAALTTALACVLFFTQIVMDGMNKSEPVKHNVHGFHDFFLAFGTLLFAFGGASTFPTIQNDMENKNKFSTSVTIAFTGTPFFRLNDHLNLESNF